MEDTLFLHKKKKRQDGLSCLFSINFIVLFLQIKSKFLNLWQCQKPRNGVFSIGRAPPMACIPPNPLRI